MDGTASIVHSIRVEFAEHRMVTAIYTYILYPIVAVYIDKLLELGNVSESITTYFRNSYISLSMEGLEVQVPMNSQWYIGKKRKVPVKRYRMVL